MGNSLAYNCSGGLLECGVAGAASIAHQEANNEDECDYYSMCDRDRDNDREVPRLSLMTASESSVSPNAAASTSNTSSTTSNTAANNLHIPLIATAPKNEVSALAINTSNSSNTNTNTINNNHNNNNNNPIITSAGPWMNDADLDRSQLDPLPLVNEFDQRPSTRDLINQHSHAIQQVKRRLQGHPGYHPVRHDELWILRYLLSQKTVAKAVACAKLFIDYRAKRHLDDTDLRAHPPSLNATNNHGVRTYFQCLDQDAMVFSWPDPDRGIVIMARLAGFHQAELMTHIPEDNEDWPFWYFMEWSFQVLDSVTRRTGRLTKGIRLVDLEGYSLNQNDRQHVSRSTDNAKQVQDQYPQMLASVFLVNAPSWMGLFFRIFRPLLPKRFVEKFDILPKHQTKRLLQHLRYDHVPKKFGGPYQPWPYPNRIIGLKEQEEEGLTVGEEGKEEELNEEMEVELQQESTTTREPAMTTTSTATTTIITNQMSSMTDESTTAPTNESPAKRQASVTSLTTEQEQPMMTTTTTTTKRGSMTKLWKKRRKGSIIAQEEKKETRRVQL